MASRFCKGKSITGRLGNARAAFKMNQTAICLKDAERFGPEHFRVEIKAFLCKCYPELFAYFRCSGLFCKGKNITGRLGQCLFPAGDSFCPADSGLLFCSQFMMDFECGCSFTITQDIRFRSN
jgi:hypothetical protein